MEIIIKYVEEHSYRSLYIDSFSWLTEKYGFNETCNNISTYFFPKGRTNNDVYNILNILVNDNIPFFFSIKNVVTIKYFNNIFTELPYCDYKECIELLKEMSNIDEIKNSYNEYILMRSI